ncbi:hypothetical protein CEXT_186061 [Caerostris extrusa]|uniref:Uncharacterized protein n=1 Tax=Caerostris extrusa TaxID=172846 RepID=A0AAV4PBG9_CAEEX|nr:hypothetical protein CEXT_186061 [Caerostris extrusa]
MHHNRADCQGFSRIPKWLLATGRYEETGRLLRNIASTNGRGLSPDYVVNLKSALFKSCQDDSQVYHDSDSGSYRR